MDGWSTSGGVQLYCDTHWNEELKYYCFSCRTYVCSDCILELHSVHKVRKVWPIKGIRFTDPVLSVGRPIKMDADLVKMLNDVEISRNKATEISETVSIAINKRAEDVLRNIKKIRNELLEECRNVTKQNYIYLNELENRIKSKLNGHTEQETEKLTKKLFMKNAQNNRDHLHEENENDNRNIIYPQINIPIFEPGIVNMQTLKVMFGEILVREDVNGHTINQKDTILNGKENIPAKMKNRNVQTDSKVYWQETFESDRNVNFQVDDFFSIAQQSDRDLEHSDAGNRQSKEQQSRFAYVHTLTKESLPQENDIKTEDLNVEIKNTKKMNKTELTLHDLPIINFENKRVTHNHARSVDDSGEMPCCVSLQPVLQFTIECEENPVCCLCVVGLESCWVHQGFSTTNFLLQTKSSKRKKIEFNFVVEDWTIKPPNTLVAVDYNNRIVKLTPLGNSHSPLSATQNIGWSFHHTDLHPIAIALCKNGDFLVSVVDTWSYNLDNNSRRQVVRINEKFEKIKTLEYIGTKRMFTTPRRLAENTNGDICVLDEISENRGQILVFNIKGSLVFAYSGCEEDNTHFNPNGICCDSKSRIIISDYTSNKLHIIDQNGTFLQCVTHLDISNPFSLTIDSIDRVWIGLKSGKILVISLRSVAEESYR